MIGRASRQNMIGDYSRAELFAGTKGTGTKYWYGWVNPRRP